MLTLAISQGRIWQDSMTLLAKLGLAPENLVADSRKLILPAANPDFRLIMARSRDTATFVACNAAAAGITGSDALAETPLAGICQPLDLRLAHCRMVVATSRDFDYTAACRGLPLTVATKYVNIARRHFAKRGVQARFIKLHGALEIAPQVGLADAIVDLVDSGNSLRANGLVEHEKIMDVSAMLIINRIAARRQRRALAELQERFVALIGDD